MAHARLVVQVFVAACAFGCVVSSPIVQQQHVAGRRPFRADEHEDEVLRRADHDVDSNRRFRNLEIDEDNMACSKEDSLYDSGKTYFFTYFATIESTLGDPEAARSYADSGNQWMTSLIPDMATSNSDTKLPKLASLVECEVEMSKPTPCKAVVNVPQCRVFDATSSPHLNSNKPIATLIGERPSLEQHEQILRSAFPLGSSELHHKSEQLSRLMARHPITGIIKHKKVVAVKAHRHEPAPIVNLKKAILDTLQYRPKLAAESSTLKLDGVFGICDVEIKSTSRLHGAVKVQKNLAKCSASQLGVSGVSECYYPTETPSRSHTPFFSGVVCVEKQVLAGMHNYSKLTPVQPVIFTTRAIVPSAPPRDIDREVVDKAAQQSRNAITTTLAFQPIDETEAVEQLAHTLDDQQNAHILAKIDETLDKLVKISMSKSAVETKTVAKFSELLGFVRSVKNIEPIVQHVFDKCPFKKTSGRSVAPEEDEMTTQCALPDKLRRDFLLQALVQTSTKPSIQALSYLISREAIDRTIYEPLIFATTYVKLAKQRFAKSLYTTTHTVVDPSTKTYEFIARMTEMCEQRPTRYCVLGLSTLVHEAYSMMSDVWTSSGRSGEQPAVPQPIVQAVQFLVGLIQPGSCQAGEMLRRSFEPTEYDAIMLAMKAWGNAGDVIEAVQRDFLQKFALPCVSKFALVDNSTFSRGGNDDEWLTNGRRQSTREELKQQRRQHRIREEQQQQEVTESDEDFEPIHENEEEESNMDNFNEGTQLKRVRRRLPTHHRSHSRTTTMSDEEETEESDNQAEFDVRDERYPHNVTCAAIFSIRRTRPTAESKRILFEILKNPNAPVESRTAAGVLFTRFLGYDTRTEIAEDREMIQELIQSIRASIDEQIQAHEGFGNYQVLSFLVTHWKNVLRSNDPYYMPIARLLTTVEPILFDILTEVEREISQRRGLFSRAFEFSFYYELPFAVPGASSSMIMPSEDSDIPTRYRRHDSGGRGLPVGFQYEQIWIFSKPQSRLPSYISTNFSIGTILGPYFNAFEIGLDMHGVERKLEETFGRVGLRGLLSTATNIFDKMFVLTSRWFTQWEDVLYHYVHPQQLWSTMKASVMMLSTKRPEEWVTPENLHQARTIAEKLALAVQTGDKEPLVNELEKVLPQSVNVRRLAYKLDVITMRVMKAKKYPINRDDVLDVITIFTGLPQARVETMLNKFEKSIGQPVDTLIEAVRTFDAKLLFDISSKLFDKNIVKSAEKTLATLLGATYSERDGQIDWDNTFNTNEPIEEKMMRIMDKIENCVRGFNLGFNFKTGGNELAYANLQEVLSIVFHRVPAAVRFVMDLKRNLLSDTDGTGSSGSKKSWMPVINAKLFDMKLSIPSGSGLQMSTGIKTHLSAAVKTSVKKVQGSKAVVKFAPSIAFETDVTLMKVGLPGLFDVKLASKTALLHKSDFGLHAKQLARKHAQFALILPQKPIIWAQFDHKLVLRTVEPGSTTCAEKPVLFFLDQTTSAMLDVDVHENEEESETLVDDADTQAFRIVGKKVSLCAPHMLQNIVSVRMCAHITSPAIGRMHSQMQMPFTEFTTAAPLVLVKRVMKFVKLAFIGPTKFQLVAKPMPRIMNKMVLIDAKWSTMKDTNARQQEPWEIAEHQQLEIVPTDKLVLRAVLQDVSSDEFLSNHAEEHGQAEEEQMHQTDTGRRHHRHRPMEDEASEFSTPDEHSGAKELIGVAKFFINRHKKAAVAEFELAHCATKLRWLAVPQCDSHQSFSSESDVDATTKPKCFKIATQLTEKFVDIHTQTPIAEAFVHLIIRKGKDKKFLPEEEVADMITTDRHRHQDEETDEFDEETAHNEFDVEESPREMRRRRRQHTHVHPVDEPTEDNDDTVPPRKHVVSTNVTFTFGIRAPGWITFVMKNSALKNAHKIWIEHQCVHECPCLTVFVPTSDKISWSLFKAKNWMTKKFMALSKTKNNMRPVGSLTSIMVEDDTTNEPATTNDWSWMNKYGDKIVDTWTKPLKFKLSYGMDSNKPFSHYYTPTTRDEETGETFDKEKETSTDVDKKHLQVLKWFVTLKQYNIPDMYFPDQAVDSGKRDVEPLIIALWSAEVDTKKWKFVKLYSKLLWNMPFQDDALNMAKIEYIWHNATTSKHAEKRSIDYQLIMETPLIAADLTARIKSTGLDENGKYRTSHRAGIVVAPWLTKNSVSFARWASAKTKCFTATAPTMDEGMYTTADEHEMSEHNPIFVPLGKIMGTADEELLRRQHKRHMVRIFPGGQVETSVGFTKFNMSLVTITSAAGMDETTPVDSLEDDVKMSRKLSNLRRRHEHTSIDTPKLHMNAEWLVSFKPAFATDRYVQALHTNTLFDFVLNTKHIHMSSAELGTANSGEVPVKTDTIFTLGYNTAGKATMIKRIGDEQLTEMLDRNPFKFIQSEMFDDHEVEQASAMKKPLTISMAGKIKIDRRNGLTTAVSMDTKLPKWLLSVWQTGMKDQFSTMPEEDDETILLPSAVNNEDEQFLDIPTKSWSKKLIVDQLFNMNVLKRSVVSSMNITSPIWSAKTWVQLIGAKKMAMQDEEIATGDKNLLELIASSSSFSAHPALKKLATHKADAHFVVEKKSGQNDASAHKIVRAKAKFEHALISTHTEAKLKLKRIELVLPDIAERLPICTDCAMKMFNAVLPTSTLRRLAVPTKIDIKHTMLLKNARKPEFTMHLFTGNTPAASASSSENVAREDIFADTANFDSVGKNKLITLIVAVAKRADQEQPKKIVFEIGTKQPASISSAAAELHELVDTNQKSMILYAKATHIPTTKSVAVNFVALPTRTGVEVEQHNMLTGAGAEDEDFSAIDQEVSNQKKFKILQIDLKLKPTAEDDGMFMEDFVPARSRHHRVQSSSTSALTRALEGRKLVAHAHVKPQHLAKVARKLYISTLDTAIAGVDLLLPQESIDMATKKLDRLLKDPSHPIAQTFSKLAMSSHPKSLEELIATANKRTQTWMLKTLAGAYVDQSPMAFGLWSNLKDILVAAPLETKWKVQRFVPQELRPMVRDLDRMLAWVVEKIDHQSSRYARHFGGVDATELAVGEPNAMSRTYQHDELALAVRNVLVQIKHDLIATLRALKSPASSFATSGQWFSSWMSPCSLSAKANQYEAAMKIKDTIRFVFNVLEQARRSIVRAVGGRVRPASDDFTMTDSPTTPMLFGGRDFDLRELGVAINAYIPNELPSLWCSNKHMKDSWYTRDEMATESSWFSSPFSASQSTGHASMAQNVAAKLAQVATNLSQRLPIKLAVQNSPAEGVVGIDVEMPIVSGNQLKKLVDFSDTTTAQYYDYNVMNYLAKPYDMLMSVVKSFTKRTSHMWEPVSTDQMSTEQSETADNRRASGRIRHLNKSWTPTSDSSMWFNPFSSQHHYNFMTRFSDIFGSKNQRDTHRHHQHSHLPQYIGYVWSSQSESKFRFAYTMDGQFIPMPKPTTTNEPCTYLLLSDESSNMFTISVVPELKTLRLHFKEPSSVQIDFVLPNAAKSITTTIDDSSSPSSMLEEPKITLDGSHPIRHIPFESDDGTVAIKRVGREYVIVAAELGLTVRCDSIYGFCQVNATKDSHEGQRLKGLLAPKLAWSPDSQIKDNNVLARRLNAAAVGNTKQQCQVEPAQMSPQQQPQAAGALQCSEAHKQTAEKKCSQVFSAKLNNKSAWKSEAFSILHPELFMIGCVRDYCQALSTSSSSRTMPTEDHTSGDNENAVLALCTWAGIYRDIIFAHEGKTLPIVPEICQREVCFNQPMNQPFPIQADSTSQSDVDVVLVVSLAKAMTQAVGGRATGVSEVQRKLEQIAEIVEQRLTSLSSNGEKRIRFGLVGFNGAASHHGHHASEHTVNSPALMTVAVRGAADSMIFDQAVPVRKQPHTITLSEQNSASPRLYGTLSALRQAVHEQLRFAGRSGQHALNVDPLYAVKFALDTYQFNPEASKLLLVFTEQDKSVHYSSPRVDALKQQAVKAGVTVDVFSNYIADNDSTGSSGGMWGRHRNEQTMRSDEDEIIAINHDDVAYLASGRVEQNIAFPKQQLARLAKATHGAVFNWPALLEQRPESSSAAIQHVGELVAQQVTRQSRCTRVCTCTVKDAFTPQQTMTYCELSC